MNTASSSESLELHAPLGPLLEQLPRLSCAFWLNDSFLLCHSPMLRLLVISFESCVAYKLSEYGVILISSFMRFLFLLVLWFLPNCKPLEGRAPSPVSEPTLPQMVMIYAALYSPA
jgi:hypothetical protein